MVVTFFPSAEVHRISEAGHYVVEDAHERILPLMRQFLGSRRDPEVTPIRQEVGQR